MKWQLSLRGRVLVGAILWTIGLFTVTGVALTHLMLRYREAPVVLHRAFSHYTALSILSLVCMALGLWQVRRGLSPLNDLRARLSAVRDGQEARVTGNYPAEVQPLVNELNALLDHREQAVRRALAKAADLAHGLKTPLAVLSHEAERAIVEGQDEIGGAVHLQVERMRRHVEYHLAHARAAASGATPGARSSIRESAEGLARTLLRLHADRGLAIDVDVPGNDSVQVHREDLDEMLGNLLDNACKWARGRVVLSASDGGRRAVITVEDDGPGLSEAMRSAVLQRGVRADEAAPGSGLGLAIVCDLAEVYGGTVSLDRAPAGGLRARLELPR